MSNSARFAACAVAFEKAYENDQWSELEQYFSDDAVYQVGLPILGAERCEGRAALLAWFPDVLDRFDRRFASRELTLIDGPKENGNEVWIHGAATYRAEGVPDFALVLEETVRFEDGLIVHLEDRYTPEMAAETEAYLREYCERLGIEIAADG